MIEMIYTVYLRLLMLCGHDLKLAAVRIACPILVEPGKKIPLLAFGTGNRSLMRDK